MKEYQFSVQYRGIPSTGFEGVCEQVIINAETPDGYSEMEFISALKYMIEDIWTSATITFQGATQ
jgi:hypothetical protein